MEWGEKMMGFALYIDYRPIIFSAGPYKDEIGRDMTHFSNDGMSEIITKDMRIIIRHVNV